MAEKGSARNCRKISQLSLDRVKRRRHRREIQKNQIAIVAGDRDDEVADGERAVRPPGGPPSPGRPGRRGAAAQSTARCARSPQAEMREQTGVSKKQPGIALPAPGPGAGLRAVRPSCLQQLRRAGYPRRRRNGRRSLSGVASTAGEIRPAHLADRATGWLQHQRFPGGGDRPRPAHCCARWQGRDRRRKDRSQRGVKPGAGPSQQPVQVGR